MKIALIQYKMKTKITSIKNIDLNRSKLFLSF